MFDGNDYNRAFLDTSKDLEKDNSQRSVQVGLVSLEWTLYEAIRGTFFVHSIGLGCVIVTALLWLFDFGNSALSFKILILSLIVVLVLFNYFALKFIFWYDVGRRIAPRHFGEIPPHDNNSY